MAKVAPALCLRAVEFRATGDATRDGNGDGRTLEGYAAVFGATTRISGWEGDFEEEISRGAFRKTLRERMPVLQFDHGRDARTGTVPIGSIQEIREDEHGLYVSARLYDNPVVEPIRQAIEGGSIDGMSFRFKVIRDEWRDKNGKLVKPDQLVEILYSPGHEQAPLKRTIREVQLFEAGPVVFPAYEATSVGVRSMLNSLDAEDRAQLLRELLETSVTAASTEEAEEERSETAEEAEAEEERSGELEEDLSSAVREDTLEEGVQDAEEKPDAARSGTSGEDNKSTVTPPSGSVDRKDTAMADKPMTVDERAERMDEIKARLNEINTEFAGAELPENVQREWNELGEEYRLQERAIEAVETRRAQLAALSDEATGEQRENPFANGRRSTGARVRRPENIYDLAEIRSQARSVEEIPGLMRDNAMRAIEEGRYGVANREKAQETVERLVNEKDTRDGKLAERILRTGSKTYERAWFKAVTRGSVAGLGPEEVRALSLGVDAEGGYAVPFQLDPTLILTGDGSTNPLRDGMARVEQIVGKEWQGLTSAGITVTRNAESTRSSQVEATEREPDLDQPNVRPTKVDAFIRFSNELDEDWAGLRSSLAAMLQEAKDDEEADSFINGDGTGLNPGGVVGSLPSASEVLDGGTFTAADVYDLYDELGPKFRRNAQFLGANKTYSAIRQFAEADGHDLWERIGNGMPAQIIGRPAREASEVPVAAADGDRYLVFGDFRQFLIVDRIGMNVELVPHVLGTNNRPTGQRGIYAYWRNSSLVLVPNAFRVLTRGTAS